MKDKILVSLWINAKKISLYTLWIVVLFGLSIYFYGELTGEDKTALIQGKTSNGHYQIEEQCDACHDSGLGGQTLEQSETEESEVTISKLGGSKLGEVNQDKCTACHAEKNKGGGSSNSHFVAELKKIRHAEKLLKIPADKCVTCHTEHQAGHSGVTQPADFCILCHAEDFVDNEITGEKAKIPSHKGFSFDKCGDCHQYHDNAANYKDDEFIAAHLVIEKNLLKQSAIPDKQYPKSFKKHISNALTWQQKEHPISINTELAEDWDASSHALAGVNCNACHQNKGEWQDKPEQAVCKTCHKQEMKEFLSSKHGIRVKQGMSAMTTEQARLTMHGENKELSCLSCHKDHQFDIKEASVEACLACHDDKHSRAYKETQHYQLWKNGDPMGVSCATCHLPRFIKTVGKKKKRVKYILTQHNQSDNLRPNQKMAKSVCVNCHSLGFSIDALQDKTLINNNYSKPPAKHIPLVEMWREKLQ